MVGQRVLLWLAVVGVAEVGVSALLDDVVDSLRNLPVIGNILQASFHPVFRPVMPSLQAAGHRESTDEDLESPCYEDLGCLYTSKEFYHPFHRPVNVPPYSREQVNVKYTLYTRKDREGTTVGAQDVKQLVNTSFSPFKKTKILIHGFLSTNTVTWMLEMTRALLVHDDFNVVAVDWSGGSRALYTQATANTRLVGLEVAHLIRRLHELSGLSPQDVHIIGHSLGAHAAGYAGERVTGLGRITGLDPAEPYFQHLSPRVRLDPTDAAFVDVIHTDTNSILALGLRQPVGHLDFYPNDGGAQPGCETIARVPLTAMTDGKNIFEGLDAAQRDLVACRHYRAPKLFTDAIFSSCPYIAFQCESYKQYLAGQCTSCGEDGSKCARLGLQAERWPGRNRTQRAAMFLSTADGPNYCLYHYRLIIEVAHIIGRLGSVRGHLHIYAINANGQIRELHMAHSAKTFHPGRSYTFLAHHRQDLSDTQEILVHWSYEASPFDPSTLCVLFCDTSLPLGSISFSSVDQVANRRYKNYISEGPDNVAMCHKQGHNLILIKSGETVKLASSPKCDLVTRRLLVLLDAVSRPIRYVKAISDSPNLIEPVNWVAVR
ncbi:LOW QUALITY PROTEIN: pancreatic triacylglycerol lipase-like [Penaeus chinensis]|uniref:LOW QUALITY PROTEIN: pancreatic triacylglycerol lipase-like n=1 Tax=Penaeus chinensis TaxID=139456 RepID=UPI001FB75E51|nr:LOW QUALITY PROTEIN: pancreatic triacylglycerol lipase-like [Penaeus chinensis]